jgi:hypothetical protein
MTVGVMLPVPSSSGVPGLTSSVTVCASVSALVAAPVLNSLTWPLTSIDCPTDTVGTLLVKTNKPSEVAGLPSPTGSWKK